ncbi:MAG: hypothetical protein ABI151_14575 [Chitinophagaceae bacterium]
MKKILLALSLFLGTASFVTAQTKPVTTTTKTARDTTRKPMMKKDGSPDKRYKENKMTEPVVGPKKKDGTPDMRYKNNQADKKKTTKP